MIYLYIILGIIGYIAIALFLGFVLLPYFKIRRNIELIDSALIPLSFIFWPVFFPFAMLTTYLINFDSSRIYNLINKLNHRAENFWREKEKPTPEINEIKSDYRTIEYKDSKTTCGEIETSFSFEPYQYPDGYQSDYVLSPMQIKDGYSK